MDKIIAQKGPLVLFYDQDYEQYWVRFADWFTHQGEIPLEFLSRFPKIYSKTVRRDVSLSGCDADVVLEWADQYLKFKTN